MKASEQPCSQPGAAPEPTARPESAPRSGWWRSEWASNLILVAAFLPITLPNLWAGKWRHSLFQLLLWLAVFGCRRWAALSLLPFYLATPILTFVSQHYGPADLDLLSSIRGSSSFSEKLAFFQVIPASYYALYCLILVPVLAYLALRGSPRPQTPAPIRWVCLLAAGGIFLGWWVSSYRLKWQGDTWFASVLVEHLGRYQPLGLPVSLTLTALDADGQQEATLQRGDFRYNATSPEKLDTVVFVVGESSRADHWHLNGYARPTTPKLESIPHLISFSHLLSLAPNTVLSWPFLFTPKVAGNSAHWPTQKSFISAFKEAGYSTAFVSFCMDQTSTRRDPLAIIAFEADRVVNGCASSGPRSTDMAMLPDIRQILAAQGPKLVVISTQGSHIGFERKSLSGYDVFQPSVLTGTKTREGWLNGYDNTIRLTDDFLASIVAQLQALGGRTVLFYVSDHGLACCDPGERFLGQAFTKPEYRPACIAWASKAFLDNPSAQTRFQFGAQHAASPVTTEYILHSFLDLCGLQTSRLDSSKSLFSSDLVMPQNRRVEDFQGHWLEFDQVPDTAN